MKLSQTRTAWIFGLFVGIFLLFIGLYPQINLWQTRGADYQGIYAYNDLDETAYAGYLQALIDGRPRRNNPFTGVDDKPGKPLPESLFSIQFVAPSIVAIPARIFGADASTALIWVSALAAFAAAVAIYWLALRMTDDALFAATATLITLCCGVLVIGEGAIQEIRHGWASYPYFPFLRRYIPAVPFPVFWTMCAAVWLLLTSENIKTRIFYCILASLSFAFLVYSYFYLWTTAAAWLACLAIVWLIFRKDNWRNDLQAFVILGLLAILTLVPYALLLASRDTTMDSVQLLVYTRAFDFGRRPETLAFGSLIALAFAVWRKFIVISDKLVLFTLSLALASIAVFNQQIITGRVLQPIHYEIFIVNYVALFAFCLTVYLVWRGTADKLPKYSRFVLPVLLLAACVWGAVEARYTIAVVEQTNAMRDETMPVGLRLRELAKTELLDENGNHRVVLPLNLLQGDDQPSIAPQGVLWARHQHVFAGESADENRERYYHFLYYAGFEATDLDRQIRETNFIHIITLFGWDRLSNRLSTEARPVTEGEVQTEVARYAAFRENFNIEQAKRLRVHYLVKHADNDFDFTTVDRWYERDAGEQSGKYVLYKLRLKQ